MHDNAVITNYYSKSGELGDGRPQFTEVTLPQTMPVTVSAPSFSVRRRAEAEGIEIASQLIIPRERLVGFGVSPAAGDRLKLRRARFEGGLSDVETHEVTLLHDKVPGLHPHRAQPVVLGLKEIRDGVPA